MMTLNELAIAGWPICDVCNRPVAKFVVTHNEHDGQYVFTASCHGDTEVRTSDEFDMVLYELAFRQGRVRMNRVFTARKTKPTEVTNVSTRKFEAQVTSKNSIGIICYVEPLVIDHDTQKVRLGITYIDGKLQLVVNSAEYDSHGDWTTCDVEPDVLVKQIYVASTLSTDHWVP